MIYQMITDLLLTNSPQQKIDIVKDYIIDSKDYTLQIRQILAILQEQRDLKATIGRESIAKRKFSNTKTYHRPQYFNDNRYQFTCITCGEKSNSAKVFKYCVKGDYTCWHALPSCFPPLWADHCQSHRRYITDMNTLL